MLDLLYVWYSKLAPLPELLVFVALAGGIAALVRAVILRRGTDSRRRANNLSIYAAMAVMAALVVLWTAGVLAPELSSIPFDETTWSTPQMNRARMAADVIDRRLLSGKTRSQVVALLGDPDGSYDLCDQSWMLYRPRDTIIPVPPELAVDYDSAGVVERVYIVPSPHD